MFIGLACYKFQTDAILYNIKKHKINIFDSDFLLYTRTLSSKPFKSVFEYKINFEFVFSHCEFTKVFLYSKSLCEIFVLKLSGIQRYTNL
jgi:hypothetical protein